MDCSDFDKFLPTYLDQTVPDEEKEEFELHCFECEKCGEELIRIKEFFLGMEIDVTEKAQDPVKYYLALAEYAEKQEDYEEAANLYRKALELCPDDESIKSKIHQSDTKEITFNGKSEDGSPITIKIIHHPLYEKYKHEFPFDKIDEKGLIISKGHLLFKSLDLIFSGHAHFAKKRTEIKIVEFKKGDLMAKKQSDEEYLLYLRLAA